MAGLCLWGSPRCCWVSWYSPTGRSFVADTLKSLLPGTLGHSHLASLKVARMPWRARQVPCCHTPFGTVTGMAGVLTFSQGAGVGLLPSRLPGRDFQLCSRRFPNHFVGKPTCAGKPLQMPSSSVLALEELSLSQEAHRERVAALLSPATA